jgi:putative ABC transport system ATP-binding protein
MNQSSVTPASFAAQAVAATKIYGEGPAAVRALDGISLDIERGRFTAIMGPSGSGKSTLLHCLAGLDELTSGTIRIGDVDLGTLDDDELTRLRRDRIGFVFQAFNLVPTLNALENITLPISIAGEKPEAEWLGSVVETLHLGDRLTHRPSQLSGGQQQRVAAARALITRPDLVFADEPSGNLDSRSGSQLLEFLRQAVDQFGQTIVMVTHDANAAAVADRIVFLADGKVTDEMGSPSAAAILDRLKHLES